MSQQLINRSTDLKRLQDEGFDLEIRDSYLIIKNIPYVNMNKGIAYGALASELSLAGDVTTRPGCHTVHFAGDFPCSRDGVGLNQIINSSNMNKVIGDMTFDHYLSSKPVEGYKDYYEKMTTYISIISSHAEAINPTITAKAFPLIQVNGEEGVFNYLDTASSRVGISLISKKLALNKIAIIGLGGTGSYILDLVSKTPVQEIHIFDGDKFLQHNAFRSPGASSIEDLRKTLHKVDYFCNQYSKMRRGIVPHPIFIDESNIEIISEFNFVFLCIDSSKYKKIITSKLEQNHVSFIDVGMGLNHNIESESLSGILKITTSTPKKRDHFSRRVSMSDTEIDNVYSTNIQVADLNALNAALAVIKWKKLFGFYLDYDHEYHTTYTVDGNMIVNDEKDEA